MIGSAMRRVLLGLVSSWLLGGCATLDPGDYATWSAVPGDRRGLDFGGLPLRSGQIILSEQATPGSLFMALAAEDYAPFIHAGVVVVEPDGAWVYEARATLWPSWTRPPTHSLVGRIQRVPIARHVARHSLLALHDPPAGVDIAAMIAYVRARYADGTPFDGLFDAEDDSRLYCNEFVARALQAGGHDVVATAFSANRSLGVVLDWLDVQGTRLFTAGDVVRGSKQVALISRRQTSAQIEAYFAARHELHLRFAATERLGALFEWGPLGLKLRSPVARFFKEAAAVADMRAGEELELAVAAIARKRFGDVSGHPLEKAGAAHGDYRGRSTAVLAAQGETTSQ